jgi:hypothetical protein
MARKEPRKKKIGGHDKEENRTLIQLSLFTGDSIVSPQGYRLLTGMTWGVHLMPAVSQNALSPARGFCFIPSYEYASNNH